MFSTISQKPFSSSLCLATSAVVNVCSDMVNVLRVEGMRGVLCRLRCVVGVVMMEEMKEMKRKGGTQWRDAECDCPDQPAKMPRSVPRLCVWVSPTNQKQRRLSTCDVMTRSDQSGAPNSSDAGTTAGHSI